MKTQGVSQRPQQPPQIATQKRVEDNDEREISRVYFSQGKTVEDMDLIALAHMSVEEAATVLLQKPLVSAEEFRAFWDRAESINREARKEVSEMEIQMEKAELCQEDAEILAQDLSGHIADEKKKSASLETDVADLEIELANVKAVLRNQ